MFTTTFNARYLDLGVSPVRIGEITIIQSLTGTGKTTLLKAYLEPRPQDSCVAITHRRSLARFLAGKLGFECYLDSRKDAIVHSDNFRVVVSMESLHRLKKSTGAVPIPKVLLLDEYCSLTEHYASSTMTRGRRLYFTEIICHFLCSSTCTSILLDAYIDDSDIELLHTVMAPGKRINVNINEYRDSTKNMTLYTDSRLFHKAMMASLMSCITEEPENIYIVSNSKEQLLGIYAMFTKGLAESNISRRERDNIMEKTRILSSDSLDSVKEEFSTRPDESWVNVDRLFCTPTITAGVSFDIRHFHKVYAVAVNNTSSPRSFLQQINRVRDVIDGEFHVCVPTVDNQAAEVTVEEVFSDLAIVQAWLGAKFRELIDIEFTENDGCLIPAIKRDSVHNHLIVKNIAERINFKSDYTGRLEAALEFDWFDVEYAEGDPNIFMNLEYQKNGKELKKAVARTEALIPEEHMVTVGDWDRNLLKDQPLIIRLSKFYNLFPTYGPLDIRTGYSLDENRVAEFVSKYEHTEYQERFEKIFFSHDNNALLIDEGRAADTRVEASSILYIRNLLLRMFEITGVVSDSSLGMVTPDKRLITFRRDMTAAGEEDLMAISLLKKNIRSVAIHMRDYPVPKLKEEMIFYMYDKLTDMIISNKVVFSLIVPTTLISRISMTTKTQKDLTNLTKIVTGCIKWCGLTTSLPGKKAIPITAYQLRVGGARFRIREYKILNFHDRYLLAIYRSIMTPASPFFRSSNWSDDLAVVHPDPWGLLKEKGDFYDDGTRPYTVKAYAEYLATLEDERRRNFEPLVLWRSWSLEV